MSDPPASSHFDPRGNPRMVDVSHKPSTLREATACGEMTMSAAAAAMIREGRAKKGDVLAVAQIAGIQAAKWTQTLIPLCHSLPLEAVELDFDWLPPERVEETPGAAPAKPRSPQMARRRCFATVRCSGKTGVEMEAMTAVSVACLTVYDMLKSVDRQMQIGPIWLQAKSGGKTGDFQSGYPPRRSP